MQKIAPVEFDAYEQSYTETVNRAVAFSGLKVDFFTRVKVDYFSELLESLAPSVARAEVVDIGCGVANSHPLLTDRVGRLVGVDVSKACIAKAAADNPKNEYKLYDGHNLPYPDGAFDAASAVCVFTTSRLQSVCDWRAMSDVYSARACSPFEHNSQPAARHVVNNCEFDKDAILLVDRKRNFTKGRRIPANIQPLHSHGSSERLVPAQDR
jgi:SAM-dependent methyltransferase